MNAEAMYDRMSKILDGLDDAGIVDAIREARAQKANPYILAALVAEATVRGIALD